MAETAPPRPPASGETAGGDRVARAVWDWRAAADAEGAAAGRRRRAAAARREGLVRAAVGAVIGALVWLWKPVLGAVVLAITLAVLLLALASPLGAYRALAAALERFGHAVGVGVTWALMTLIFYLLFFPVGRARRALGRLGLTFGPERGRASYWERAAWERVTPESYRRQF
jgi:hypothetical protein